MVAVTLAGAATILVPALLATLPYLVLGLRAVLGLSPRRASASARVVGFRAMAFALGA